MNHSRHGVTEAMKNYQVSACYFPTRIILIDDNASYLNSLASTLNSEGSTYATYSDQHKALAYLSRDYKPNHFVERIISHPEEFKLNHRSIDVNLKSIHEEIYNPHRFNEISVIAVDYSMPGLTGRELCEKVRALPFKKLMLTGEADAKLAIELLNRHIIDQFVSKSAVDFHEVVNDTLQKLQSQFFLEQTQIVIDSLMYSSEHQPPCLTDIGFIELFFKCFHSRSNIEYYILDSSGSFLFLTDSGEPSYLALRSEEDMITAEELIEYADNPSANALAMVKSRQKLLFWQTNDPSSDINDWDRLLFPATKLDTAHGTYYYSYITEAKAFNIDTKRVVSFNHFLDNGA